MISPTITKSPKHEKELVQKVIEYPTAYWDYEQLDWILFSVLLLQFHALRNN